MGRLRPVPNFEGRYSVDENGNVYSYVTGRYLRPGRKASGHYSVALGRGNSFDVHVLVMLAFKGPRPEGAEVRHLNGDPSDNRLTNLAWGTKSDNTRDRKWHSRPRNQVLTPERAKAVRRLALSGAVGTHVARDFGISKSAVYAIRDGRYHTDV